ncbi:histidine kinase [Saccharopolyspora erythraea NRRL 2338]|nr:histidine kinase [Saccharopolyspora erythraea NRRL 2338]
MTGAVHRANGPCLFRGSAGVGSPYPRWGVHPIPATAPTDHDGARTALEGTSEMTERREVRGDLGTVPAPSPGASEWLHRRRLERKLHDGPALRLAALSLRLGVCSHRARDEQLVHECLAGAQDELHAVLQELREVASQIYPPVLATAGLGVALEAMAERFGMPLSVRAPAERFSAEVEAAAYFEVAESVARLSDDAVALEVAIDRVGDELVLDIAAQRKEGAERGPDDVITVRMPCE